MCYDAFITLRISFRITCFLAFFSFMIWSTMDIWLFVKCGKFFLMFTWFFYRCTGLRNVLCIIWVSLKCTHSRGKDVSILFATHWEVLKSGMNKIICMGVKRWYYPCVNNPTNLQFSFCNRRKDVGALSILCAGGKVPISFSNLKCCFFLVFMLNSREETQGHRSWMRLFSKQHNLSFLSSCCFFKSFIGSTACVFSFSLNTHV